MDIADRPAIDATDIRYTYDGWHDVLQGVTLRVPQGAHVAILGHNGSGKSTLARCLGGLLVPTAGSAQVLGLDLCDQASLAAIRRQVGLVFQNPDNQMVTSVVADDVAFGPENLGVPHDEIVRRVDEALDVVGMADYAQADPSELSGGQKRRVAIAGALALQPRMLVLDEPGAMLDPAGRASLRELLSSLNSRGTTIVHISHFMEDALAADAVAVMAQGRVVLQGSPQAVFSQADRLRELGLEEPFSLQLAHALRRGGMDVPDALDLASVEEEICRSSSRP